MLVQVARDAPCVLSSPFCAPSARDFDCSFASFLSSSSYVHGQIPSQTSSQILSVNDGADAPYSCDSARRSESASGVDVLCPVLGNANETAALETVSETESRAGAGVSEVTRFGDARPGDSHGRAVWNEDVRRLDHVFVLSDVPGCGCGCVLGETPSRATCGSGAALRGAREELKREKADDHMIEG
jgi:hypothetical protein